MRRLFQPLLCLLLLVSPLLAEDTGPMQPVDRLVAFVQEASAFLDKPEPGKSHLVRLSGRIDGLRSRPLNIDLQLVIGSSHDFFVNLTIDDIDTGFGQQRDGATVRPWLRSRNGTLFLGEPLPLDAAASNPLRHTEPWIRQIVSLLPFTLTLLQANPGALGTIEYQDRTLQITRGRARSGSITFDAADKPTAAKARWGKYQATCAIREWEINRSLEENEAVIGQNKRIMAASATVPVASADLHRMFGGLVNFLAEYSPLAPKPAAIPFDQPLTVRQRDPAGHGMLCTGFGKRVLFVSGTPEQMGAAHGNLLAPSVNKLLERVLFVVGMADTIYSNRWFPEQLEEIQTVCGPHVPARFLRECDALAAAAGIAARDARLGNLFPERFHCSGVAVRGRATIDGQLYHARVLDYMRDIMLQNEAVVQVFLPNDGYRWISQGYAGLVGTVTAMNEKGLAVGEIGGRGEGAWAGLPMSLLLREIMEKAADVDKAVDLLRNTPRTCEYYYVFSDAARRMLAVHATPQEIQILQPGEQHERLPQVLPDTVFISEGRRAEELSRRLRRHYGKIDATVMIELIKRPVAMESNLHNAIFRPETGDLWLAEAGKTTPACDEPYSKFNMHELFRFYSEQYQKQRLN